MRKLLLITLMVLVGSSCVYSQVHPITLQKKTATGTIAAPSYDTATETLTNIFIAKPVYIVGTPPVILMNTASLTISVSTQTTALFSGFDNAVTLSVGTAAAVVCPSLSPRTRCVIYGDFDCNYGAASVNTGTNSAYIPGDAPGMVFSFNTVTPTWYFRGRLKTVTLTLTPMID